MPRCCQWLDHVWLIWAIFCSWFEQILIGPSKFTSVCRSSMINTCIEFISWKHCDVTPKINENFMIWKLIRHEINPILTMYLPMCFMKFYQRFYFTVSHLSKLEAPYFHKFFQIVLARITSTLELVTHAHCQKCWPLSVRKQLYQNLCTEKHAPKIVQLAIYQRAGSFTGWVKLTMTTFWSWSKLGFKELANMSIS